MPHTAAADRRWFAMGDGWDREHVDAGAKLARLAGKRHHPRGGAGGTQAGAARRTACCIAGQFTRRLLS